MMAGKKHPRLWVVVADGEHARVVGPTATHMQFATRNALDSITAGQRSRELTTDRPGRVGDTAGSGSHAMTPRTDPHKAAKHAFVVDLAHHLDEQAAAGEFDQLVLVAPAHALHDLKETLGSQAGKMVVGSLGKDLTRVPDHELSKHLEEWWSPPEA